MLRLHKPTIITVHCTNQNMKSFSFINPNTFNRTRARIFVHGLHGVSDISNQFNQTNKQVPNLVVWFQANKRNCSSVYNVNAGVNLVPQQTQWCNGHHPVMGTRRLQEWTLETRYKYMCTRLRETPVFQLPLILPFNVGHTVELVNFLKGKELHPKQLKMLIELLTLLGSVVMLMKMYRNLMTYIHLKKKNVSCYFTGYFSGSSQDLTLRHPAECNSGWCGRYILTFIALK